MTREQSILSDEVRREIRHHTNRARTRKELRVSLFEAFQRLHIDPSDVSLADMKTAIVIAGRAIRKSGGESPLNMPA